VKESTGSLPDSTHFFQGDLGSFLSQTTTSDRCILVFIDGDHTYDGVLKDIRAILQSRLARPLSIAFHDFALRYADDVAPNVRVDDAIFDALGNETLMPMGDLSGLSSLHCEPSSETFQSYIYKGGSEGVLITLAPQLPSREAAVRGPVGLRAFVGRLGKRVFTRE
jgi:hypothetical protein